MTTQNTTPENVADQLAMKATIAHKSLKKTRKKSKWLNSSFDRKVAWESHQYVKFIIEECTEISNGGFGSCDIKMDKTTDLFMVDEGRFSAYSVDFVCRLLQSKGFTLDFTEAVDFYDAILFRIVWAEKLPKSSYQIGMSWKK